MRTKSRAIGHIIKSLSGKRLPKASKWDIPSYEFPDSLAAEKAVWSIHAETGRECANSGNIVTVYT